jgi:D-3-phosphoglycerate dehydrogenase
VYRPELSVDDLPDLAPGHDVLVVRSTPVSKETLSSGGRLKLVIRAGAGVDTIDVDAASDAGIVLSNVPGKNAIAVAELAFGLMVAIDRNIPDAVADLRAGKWDKRRYQKGRGIYGANVGVIGFGAIGSEFASRARAFGMNVHVLERPGRPEAAQALLADLGATQHEDLPSLVRACDVLTFHVPAGPSTVGLIGRDLLDNVKPGAVIINTSRADIMDEAAVMEAIASKNIRVGLDVFPDEPKSGTGGFDSALAKHPNVSGTHHIGASTEQAQHAIAREVVAVVDAFERGHTRNALNLDTSDRGSETLVVRHRNRVGVLAAVFQVLVDQGINVEQMDNRIFSGGGVAVATMHVSGDLDDEAILSIAALPDVIEAAIEPVTEAP